MDPITKCRAPKQFSIVILIIYNQWERLVRPLDPSHTINLKSKPSTILNLRIYSREILYLLYIVIRNHYRPLS